MGAPVTTDGLWAAIDHQLFGVLGYVTPRGEARTAGIVYSVHDHKLYIATGRTSWKARHIALNPAVSVTVVIPKRIPFMPWIRIPAATICLHGDAVVRDFADVAPEARRSLMHGLDRESEGLRDVVILEIRPRDDFVSYGVGVPLLTMRNTDAARGRAPVAGG